MATACLVFGSVLGLSSVALHQRWWALLLALPATAAEAYALPRGWWARMAFAFGWVAMVGYLANPRREGDYVIADDPQGYILLAFAVALLIGAMVTLRPVRRGSRATEEPSS
jgi:hypothetical protein